MEFDPAALCFGLVYLFACLYGMCWLVKTWWNEFWEKRKSNV